VLITGPGHGACDDPGRRYTMEECAAAAATALDVLGINEPVDWVGNAPKFTILISKEIERLSTSVDTLPMSGGQGAISSNLASSTRLSTLGRRLTGGEQSATIAGDRRGSATVMRRRP
jgi:hypothetical protein